MKIFFNSCALLRKHELEEPTGGFCRKDYEFLPEVPYGTRPKGYEAMKLLKLCAVVAFDLVV